MPSRYSPTLGALPSKPPDMLQLSRSHEGSAVAATAIIAVYIKCFFIIRGPVCHTPQPVIKTLRHTRWFGVYLLPLARLWVLHSIWQLSIVVAPPRLHAVTWSASISEMRYIRVRLLLPETAHRGQLETPL